jgi:hypothetical protein
MLIWYSQEARPYAIVALAGTVTMFAFARVLRQGRREDFVLWSVCCAVAVAFHYFAVFLVAAEALALIVSRRPWRDVARWCIPSLLVLVVLAPVALAQRKHKGNSSWISTFPLVGRLKDAEHSALIGPSWPTYRLFVIAAIVVAVAVVLVLTRADRENRKVAALNVGIAFVALILPLMLAGVGFDLFLTRYVIAALVPLIIAISIGLTAGRAAWITVLLVVVICAVSLTTDVAVARDPNLQRANWRSVARAFNQGSTRRLLVLDVGGFDASPLLYYLPGKRGVNANQQVTVDEIDVLNIRRDTEPCNFAIGMGCTYIYLGGPLRGPLAKSFTLDRRINTGQFRIDRYRSTQPVVVRASQLIPHVKTPDTLMLVPAGVKAQRAHTTP